MNNGMFRAEDRGSCNMGTMNTEINENEINKRLNKANSIEEFYAGTGVLVTGATGFVGKGLLEKLMRVCPRVTVIFLLIRPKSNQTIEQRFKKLINDPVRRLGSRRLRTPSPNRTHQLRVFLFFFRSTMA